MFSPISGEVSSSSSADATGLSLGLRSFPGATPVSAPVIPIVPTTDSSVTSQRHLSHFTPTHASVEPDARYSPAVFVGGGDEAEHLRASPLQVRKSDKP